MLKMCLDVPSSHTGKESTPLTPDRYHILVFGKSFNLDLKQLESTMCNKQWSQSLIRNMP